MFGRKPIAELIRRSFSLDRKYFDRQILSNKSPDIETEGRKGHITPSQPGKQTTMEMFYKKLVQNDGRSGSSEDQTKYLENKDSHAVNDLKLQLQTIQHGNQHRKRKLEAKEKEQDTFTQSDMAVCKEESAVGEIDKSLMKCTLIHKTGDLFSSSKNESLAHCVSRDLGMGKGIAVLFKKRFGGVQELRSQDKDVGDVAVLVRPPRYVYYLITKERYWEKPTYQTLQDSLLSMKKHMVEHGVNLLSMPRIGCGLDMLQWPKVEHIILKVFCDVDVNITIYTL